MSIQQVNSSRRKLLKLLAIAGVGAATYLRPLSATPASRGKYYESLESALRDMLVHRHSAKIIGLEYLRLRPRDAQKGSLMRLIFGGYPVVDRIAYKHVVDWVDQRVKADFDNDRVVIIQGWMMAETEARLCALSYFI